MSSIVPLASVSVVNGIVPPLVVLLWWIPYHARAQTLAGEGRPVPSWRQACYVAGLLVLAVALSAPVDNLADQLLMAHMAEHLLIGDVAALLLVLGLTGPLLAPALRIPVIARLRFLTHPVVAVTVWAVNFYLWHLPVLYQAALRHDWLHGFQHATFLIFGFTMWMALLGPLPKPSWFNNAWQLVYIIVVRLIGTVLGNVLVFGGTVFYPYYRPGDAHWHISPLADQIAAGSLMMIEESLLTIGLFCWLFLKVARQAEERQQLLDYAAMHDIALDEQRAARAVAAGRAPELWDRLRQRLGDEPDHPGDSVSNGAPPARSGTT
ncbi:MAG: cytochrome c oxidase assembly protein [Solirubrobacterales bacterium]|nr:cytochrome c oxidase assembly protein [Solirubrobacterales bacterium]